MRIWERTSVHLELEFSFLLNFFLLSKGVILRKTEPSVQSHKYSDIVWNHVLSLPNKQDTRILFSVKLK